MGWVKTYSLACDECDGQIDGTRGAAKEDLEAQAAREGWAKLGASWYCPACLAAVERAGLFGEVNPSPSRRRRLTRRQTEVLELIVAGLDNTAIAERLGTSVSTVDSHRHSLMVRLRVYGSARDLAEYAVRAGLVEPGLKPSP
jgi:DNA-binding NarL/FixJ family response regulator